MDIQKIEFYERIFDAIEIRTQLESVLKILRRKNIAICCLDKKECDELGIEQSGIISAVLSNYKKYLETKKPPK